MIKSPVRATNLSDGRRLLLGVLVAVGGLGLALGWLRSDYVFAHRGVSTIAEVVKPGVGRGPSTVRFTTGDGRVIVTELDAPTDVPVGGRLRIVYNRGNPYAVHGGNNVPYYVGPAAAGAAALGIGAFFVGTFVRRRRRFPGWSPMSLAEATELFTRWPGPWWIAGDRAVDRGLARAAAGPDMTILVTVPKAGMLQALLPGWEIWSYSSWPRRHRPTDDLSRTGTDELWARQADRQPWQLRILLADVDQDAWKPRWDAQSPIPLADLSQAGTDPVKFLIPELALYWQVVAARRPWTSQKIIDAVALLSKSQREKLRQTLNDGGHADAARRVLG